MSFREVGMFEVKEVLRLHLAGVAKKAIARTVGVDPKTVRRYVAVAAELGIVAPLDDEKLSAVFSALRSEQQREHGASYLACREHSAFIKQLLADGVRLTKVRKLLQRQRDVDVPYSALYRFAVKELAFGATERSVRLVDPASANEVQVDTGLVVTLVVDGKAVRKKAFIFTPTVSRYRFVYPIDRETTQAAIEACEAAWAFYGGVFEVLQPDNTKAIVEIASATSPVIITAFREYAQARGITVDPTRVRRPKDKARVEKTVAYVRDDCFGGERLTTLDAARTRALFWCEHEAGVKIHATTQRRPKEHFLVVEQPKLLPAPTEAYDLPEWAEITVDRTQHVSFAGALYMLPVALIGRKLTVRGDKSLVRFYDRGVLVKVLKRAERGGHSFDDDDIPEHKRAHVLRDHGALVAQAHRFGASIGAFAEGIVVEKAPWLRMRRLSALLNLVRRYGAARVDEACRRAVAVEMHDVDRLRRMLEQPREVVVDTAPAKVIDAKARFLRPKDTWAIKNKERP